MRAMAMPEPNRPQASAELPRAVCAECGRVSDPFWRGWLAYRVDDPRSGAAPELGFFCPECAGRGGRPARRGRT